MPKIPQVARQITGAIVGGSLALALYTAYTAVEPQLQAYVAIPLSFIDRQADDDAVRLNREVSEEKQARIAQRARETMKAYENQWEKQDYDLPLEEAEPEVQSEVASKESEEAVSNWQLAVSKTTSEDVAFSIFNSEFSISHDVTVEHAGAPPVIPPPPPPQPEFVAAPAPVLPNSGIGMQLAALCALGGAYALRNVRKKNI